MYRVKFRNIYILFVIVIFYITGFGDYAFTKSFDTEFDYPVHANIEPMIKHAVLQKKVPQAPFINKYPYDFILKPSGCSIYDDLYLLILVKSAMGNFESRQVIRQTYGQGDRILNRRSKTVFLLGMDNDFLESKQQWLINKEHDLYKDIVQADFIDNYYNNTIKTMMGFRFAYEFCATPDFFLFIDDDMYLSMENLMDYLYKPAVTSNGIQPDDHSTINPDEPFLAGYVFQSSPQRFAFSKWRISLSEYPWDKWPPYVTAGAYIVSRYTMRIIYVGSHYVEHFKFDDIYIGIIAKKLNLKLTHCDKIHYFKKPYSKEGYKDVIASHGYGSHEELLRVWKEQNNVPINHFLTKLKKNKTKRRKRYIMHTQY